MGRNIPVIPLALLAFFVLLFALKNWLPDLMVASSFNFQPSDIQRIESRPISKDQVSMIVHLSPEGVSRLDSYQRLHEGSLTNLAYDDLSLGKLQPAAREHPELLELTMPVKTAMSFRYSIRR